jgi:hypothetical protein
VIMGTEPNKDDPEDSPSHRPTRCENCMEFFDDTCWPRVCEECDKPCCTHCAPGGLCNDCYAVKLDRIFKREQHQLCSRIES